jgi:hypothetical protein
VICIVAFQVEYFCHAFQTDVLESSEIRFVVLEKCQTFFTSGHSDVIWWREIEIVVAVVKPLCSRIEDIASTVDSSPLHACAETILPFR